jgi:hypothetical protein
MSRCWLIQNRTTPRTTKIFDELEHDYIQQWLSVHELTLQKAPRRRRESDFSARAVFCAIAFQNPECVLTISVGRIGLAVEEARVVESGKADGGRDSLHNRRRRDRKFFV